MCESCLALDALVGTVESRVCDELLGKDRVLVDMPGSSRVYDLIVVEPLVRSMRSSCVLRRVQTCDGHNHSGLRVVTGCALLLLCFLSRKQCAKWAEWGRCDVVFASLFD